MKSFLGRLFKKIAKSLMRGYGLSRFKIIKYPYEKISGLFKEGDRIVDVGGMKMRLDSQDSLRLSLWGVYEEFTTKIMREKVVKGNLAIDIGAHIGYYTLILSDLVGAEGSVVSFEPSPNNRRLLQENIYLNNLHNIKVEDKIVSSKSGRKFKLFLNENNTGDNSIYSNGDNKDFIEAESISLDEYLEDSQKVDFIKMDIQGAEWEAFQGMKNILRNPGLKIVFEFAPHMLRRAGNDPEELLVFLNKYGFKIFEIRENEKILEEIRNISLFVKKFEGDLEINLFCEK